MAEPDLCPKCGAAANGRFCANCGAALSGATCSACARPLSAGAHFCQHCGISTEPRARGRPALGARAFAWLVPGVAVLALVAFLIGQRVAAGASGAGGTPSVAGATSRGVAVRAPDISQMSPEDRAKALFDRVMRYDQEGKQDSIRFFAPMAIRAYEMLGPLGAHDHYDIGIIAVVSGDAAIARAQADTILRLSPTHLLGLVLAIKAAGLRQDAVAKAGFETRLASAAAGERARNLPEYADHAHDIDVALKSLAVAKP